MTAVDEPADRYREILNRICCIVRREINTESPNPDVAIGKDLTAYDAILTILIEEDLL
jgi:hypothetical protein